jgi:hypothetical protein
MPKFERPKPDDPNRGTVNEKRRGPFPVGVAVKTKLPADWFPGTPGQTPPTVRLAVIGHGGIFIANTLSPLREKLLLDTCNWLLGREDLLNKDYQTWKFPRLQMSDNEQSLWKLGTRVGLPLMFVYLGLVMFFIRRMR